MALKWNGPRIIAKTLQAAKAGVNQTMSQAVIHAKLNHPGWKNITTTAEGSVQLVKKAEERGRFIVGLWGSRFGAKEEFNYVIVLEFKHGSFLRSAAATIYPNLAANIRRHF